MVVRADGEVSKIVSESARWTTEDVIQAENYVAAAVGKFIAAMVLILLGIALAIWFIGKIF